MVQTDRQTPLSPLDYHYNVVGSTYLHVEFLCGAPFRQPQWPTTMPPKKPATAVPPRTVAACHPPQKSLLRKGHSLEIRPHPREHGGGPHSRRAPCPKPPTSHLQVLTRAIRAAQLTNFVRFFKVFNAALMQATLWPLSAMSTSGRWQVIHDAKVRRMFR